MIPGRTSKEAKSDPGQLPTTSISFARDKHGSQNGERTVADSRFNSTISHKEPSASFAQLFRFATRFELVLDFVGLFVAACSGAAQPLMTLFFGNLIQAFLNFEVLALEANSGSVLARAQIPAAAAHFRQAAAKDTLYLVCMGIGLFCCTSIGMGVWMYNGELSAKRLRESYLRAVLHQDIAFFDCVGAGEIITRIHTDTHLVQQGMSEKVPMVTNRLVSFVTGFVLAYARNWRLALAASSILPVMVTMMTVMNNLMSKSMKYYLQHITKSVTLAVEVISTIRTAQAFGIESALADIYDSHIDRSKKIDTQSALLQGVSAAVPFFVLYGAYGLVFSFGTTLINEGHANVNSVVTVILSIFIGSASFVMLAPSLHAISQGCEAAAKLFQVIDRVPCINSADPAGLKPETVEGHITFENVHFSYPSRPGVSVSKDLSFSLLAGETVALVGASGSGKSTIISLLVRFYDPLSGVIKLDGIDIKNLNIKWLRSQIGFVSQEPTLFATTIHGNVAHGLIGTKFEDASEEKKITLVKAACIEANADSFINDLPLGYNTMVGEGGFLMSGGQKQCIAIARAIVGDPKILLLDEATSALEAQSERIVQDALSKAAAGRTTIIIAHRLSTVKDANRIFVIGDGLILEQGTHNQLLDNPSGAYSCLVAAQNLRKQREVGIKTPNSAAAVSDGAAEIGLVRRNTIHTFARDLEDRQNHHHNTKQHHSVLYVFKRIAEVNHSGWLSYGFGIVAASLSGTVYPAFGIVYSKGLRALSGAHPHQRRHDGDRVALWFFIIAIMSITLSTVQNYMFAYNAANLTAKLRSVSFRAILRQDIKFFDLESNTAGSLASNLSVRPEEVKGMAGVSLGTILQSVATLVSATILGLLFSWKLGLVALACMPVLVFTGYNGLRVILWNDNSTKIAHENSARIACESAGTIRTVASLTRENDCLHLYSQSLETSVQCIKRSAIWSSMLFATSQAIVFFVTALVFWYGSYLVSTFGISNSAFFIVLMSTTYGSLQASSTFSFVPSLSAAKTAGSKIISLLDAMPEIDVAASQDTNATETFRGHIQFQNIHFCYPGRPSVPVLRGLFFEAEPGKYTALVGASGSGKSTVIQLIERFYSPSAGQIYLDGRHISELNIKEYRQHIALVSQEPTLYAGTIRFNILLGAIKSQAEVTQEDMERVCREANIMDFINALPDGFDTEVGSKGSQLSAGQKQRIAIARALIRNPKVLLLDEATSALDSSSEQVVQDALDRAAQGRTTIAIAHRMSTIQNADYIYFIKNGIISESGTHDELLHKKGDYYAYVQLQVLSGSVICTLDS